MSIHYCLKHFQGLSYAQPYHAGNCSEAHVKENKSKTQKSDLPKVTQLINFAVRVSAWDRLIPKSKFLTTGQYYLPLPAAPPLY